MIITRNNMPQMINLKKITLNLMMIKKNPITSMKKKKNLKLRRTTAVTVITMSPLLKKDREDLVVGLEQEAVAAC